MSSLGWCQSLVVDVCLVGDTGTAGVVVVVVVVFVFAVVAAAFIKDTDFST